MLTQMCWASMWNAIDVKHCIYFWSVALLTPSQFRLASNSSTFHWSHQIIWMRSYFLGSKEKMKKVFSAGMLIDISPPCDSLSSAICSASGHENLDQQTRVMSYMNGLQLRVCSSPASVCLGSFQSIQKLLEKRHKKALVSHNDFGLICINAISPFATEPFGLLHWCGIYQLPLNGPSKFPHTSM